MRPPRAEPAAGWRGPLVPVAAAAAVLALAALFEGLVGIGEAAVPKPRFAELLLPGWPQQTPLAQSGPVVEAALWWLCLSFLLWVAALLAVGLGAWQLHRAAAHDAALARRRLALYGGAALAFAALLGLVVAQRVPLMLFGPLLVNLRVLGPGFAQLATLNTALVFAVGALLLAGTALLLAPGAHGDRPLPQMQAITRLMYAGAAAMLLWIAAATAMYRLAATLLVEAAREPLLKLAPSVGLMGGLFLSLLLAATYLSAAAWLQHRHERRRAAGIADEAEAAAPGPGALLAAHWPKVVAILLPMLPGAVGSVMQAFAQLP